MATTPTTPPSIQQPADELRAAAIAAQAPPAAPTEAQVAVPPAPAPPAEWGKVEKSADGMYQVNLSTGEVFKGTADEVIAKQAEAHVETKRWAQKKVQESTQQPVAPAPPSAISEDPAEVAARDFILNQVAKGIGLPDAQALKAQLGMISATTEEVQAQNLSMGFLAACPDFPNTKEASAALGKAMDEIGVGSTVVGMEAAHRWAIAKNYYQPVPVQTNVPARPVPPPTLNSTSAAAPGGAPDLWKMPLNDLRALAEQKK